MNTSTRPQSHQAKLVQLSSLPAIFWRFKLCFQSPLHCSSIVIVRYRFQTYIELKMKLTTHFALHSQGTLAVHVVRAELQMTDRTLTCYGNLFQGVCHCAHAGIASCDHKSRLEGLDFHAEPVPIHSPLLREYHSVSFPPLTYMLKFSRPSGSTSHLRIERYTLGRLDHT